MNKFLLSFFIFLFIQILLGSNVPVFVRLPYNVVNGDGKFVDHDKIKDWLIILKKNVNVDGVFININWGVVESRQDIYVWEGYLDLINLIVEIDLKIEISLDFHQCGNNIEEETCNFLLPDFVRKVAYQSGNWDIFYTDKSKYRDQEYISLAVDDVPVFPNNKTAINLYEDFTTNFKNAFKKFLGTNIVSVYISLGPAGELRFPSYQIQLLKWKFPGIGEFQVYDYYILQNLKKAATDEHHPEYGYGGPLNSGSYNDFPSQAPFFTNGYNNWNTDYGRFFLWWYKQLLISHGSKMLSSLKNVLSEFNISFVANIANVHWWYNTNSHAAELTAGYYNTIYYDGYLDILKAFKTLDVEVNFGGFEIRNEEHSDCSCDPQALLKQIRNDCRDIGIRLNGKNTLKVYDEIHFNKIISESSKDQKMISSFVYHFASEELFYSENLQKFKNFVYSMHNLQ